MSHTAGRILIVDDEVVVGVFLTEVLQRSGYDVSFAWRVDDALAMVHEGAAYDLAVLDICMPLMSGLELADRLRTESPTTKLLFCTGHPDAADPRYPAAAEEAVVIKPVSPAGLVDAVKTVLAKPSHPPQTMPHAASAF
jgi:CheY-like chemotaxis protein